MRNHRGISTLELVMALPILLGVMALMVNFGTVACWKVRALVMTRQRLWEGRTGRTGGVNPLPTWWPGSLSTSEGHATDLDDQRVNLPVARGPLPPGAEANSDLLDPTRGLHATSSEITRVFPMLRKLGSYRLRASSALLDGKWAFYKDLNSWYFSERRTPLLYTFEKASSEYSQAYIKAVVAIFCATFRSSLRPLDKDDEFLYYYTLFDWGTKAPDFHPSLTGFCDVEYDLADEKVTELIERIQGYRERDDKGNIKRWVPDVAESMTHAFIALYKRVIDEIEHIEKRHPTFSSDEMSELREQLPELQTKVDSLNRFLQTLTSRQDNAP